MRTIVMLDEQGGKNQWIRNKQRKNKKKAVYVSALNVCLKRFFLHPSKRQCLTFVFAVGENFVFGCGANFMCFCTHPGQIVGKILS